MNFKELFDKGIDFIDSKRKSIIKFSLSILGLILLAIVFFLSSEELSVGKESQILLNHIEQGKYSLANNYYNDLKKSFTENKMKRFNISISNKIDKLIINKGDKYINGEISKESYLSLINSINVLDQLELNNQRIIEQVKRASEMYVNENIDYDRALSYINAIATLKIFSDELDVYKHNIKAIYESRQIYETAKSDQDKYKYYEAIQGYDKVLEEDKKYYKLAQNKKEECIDNMYDYYIEKAEESNDEGNYEEALQYLSYIKKYYFDDENVLELEKKYQKNLSMYTLTSDDIINLITRKSGINKKYLSINSYQDMINGKKHYYVEVFEHETLIDELLINAENKEIYSYKDINKQYNTNYSDGYFRILDDGQVQFSISEDKAQFLLKNKLETKGVKYKNINTVSKERAKRNINENIDLDKFLGKNEDLYYYEIVNKGFFKPKDVYLINIYSEKIYKVTDDKIKEY